MFLHTKSKHMTRVAEKLKLMMDILLHWEPYAHSRHKYNPY